MSKKKIIFKNKFECSEQLRVSNGITMIEYRQVVIEMPLAYGYLADCLSKIAENGKSLLSKTQKFRPNYYHEPDLDESIRAIQICFNEGRVDLIEKAARLLQGDKELLALIRLRDTVDMCTDLPDDEGCLSRVILPTKGAVLKVFELMYPELQKHFPKEKRQQAEWWKEAECDHLPQDRRAEDTPSVKFWLQELKGELPGPTNS